MGSLGNLNLTEAENVLAFVQSLKYLSWSSEGILHKPAIRFGRRALMEGQ